MFEVKVNGNDAIRASLDEDGKLRIGEDSVPVDVKKTGSNSYHVLRGNKSYRVQVIKADTERKSYIIRVGDNRYEIELADRYDQLLRKLGMDIGGEAQVNDLKAPMPGLVVDVLVKEGQDIKKGDPYCCVGSNEDGEYSKSSCGCNCEICSGKQRD